MGVVSVSRADGDLSGAVPVQVARTSRAMTNGHGVIDEWEPCDDEVGPCDEDAGPRDDDAGPGQNVTQARVLNG
jgi:hypothetical protein